MKCEASHAYCYNGAVLLFLWKRWVAPSSPSSNTMRHRMDLCHLLSTSSTPSLAGLLPLLNEDKALRHRLLLEVIGCMGLPEAGLPGTAILVYQTHGMQWVKRKNVFLRTCHHRVHTSEMCRELNELQTVH